MFIRKLRALSGLQSLEAEPLNMRLVLVLACLLGVSLAASLPKHCKSPPLLTGAFTFSTQNEKAWFYAGYEYDAWQERIRIYETRNYNNQSFTYDVLLLYKEGAMYEINAKASKCTKKPLKVVFESVELPSNAVVIQLFVIGTSSEPGEGLLVNTWGGKASEEAQYMDTVTEFGCIPVITLYQTKEFGWVVLTYINNIKGIIDPSAPNPPPFCPSLEAKEASRFLHRH